MNYSPWTSNSDGMLRNTLIISALFVFLAGALSCGSNIDKTDTDKTSQLLHYTIPQDRLDTFPANFFGRPGEYLEWEAEQSLLLIEDAIERFPPDTTRNLVRHLVVQLLDVLFHDEQAPARPAIQDFHHRRTARALHEMQHTSVEQGAMIWKLYNMGYAIRTASVTICFDLVYRPIRNAENFRLPEQTMLGLVEQCDALFISHRHSDHADVQVATHFLDADKPVVAPAQMWQDQSIYDSITHLERIAHVRHTLPVQNGRQQLGVVAYPGHQGPDIENNVTLVITPEDLSFVHTGDQSNNEDFAWIDHVHEQFHVNVFMPNTWTTDPPRTAAGFAPSVIIPGHHNELAHGIANRESYVLSYSRWDVPYPKLLMVWGESWHYIP